MSAMLGINQSAFCSFPSPVARTSAPPATIELGVDGDENTPHTARMAHDQALGKVMQHLLKDDTQVYKQFVENGSFRRCVGDMVYALTNESGSATV